MPSLDQFPDWAFCIFRGAFLIPFVKFMGFSLNYYNSSYFYVYKFPNENYNNYAKPIKYKHKDFFCLRDIIPFLCSYYEFDKNANSISMNAEMLFVLNWFGDYRSLRFLCGYFGSRTFHFYRQKGRKEMKKAIAILLALCLCIGLCACAGSTEPAQYEDTLIEVIKIGDPLIHAEEIFGTPVSSEDYPYDPYNMHYEYKNVTIYDLEFTPNIYTGSNSEVLNLSYIYYSNIHSATYEQAYEKLLNNFIRLYGEPDEKANKANIWYFENGTRLYVSNMAIFANTYRIVIELRQQTK